MRIQKAVGGVVVGLVVCVTPSARAQVPLAPTVQPAPHSAEPTHAEPFEARPTPPLDLRALQYSGAVMFGVGYVGAIAWSRISPQRADTWLLLPLAGPWVDLATRDGCVDPAADHRPIVSKCDVRSLVAPGVVVGGIAQVVGASLLVWGTAVRRSSTDGGHIAVVPHANGLRVVGAF